MTPDHYAVLGYAIGAVLPWGYALAVWVGHRALSRQEARQQAARAAVAEDAAGADAPQPTIVVLAKEPARPTRGSATGRR